MQIGVGRGNDTQSLLAKLDQHQSIFHFLGKKDCQTRLPSSLLKLGCGCLFKRTNTRTPHFSKGVSKERVFGEKRKHIILGQNPSLLALFEEFSQHVQQGVPTPLCHTYFELSGHDDSPGTI